MPNFLSRFLSKVRDSLAASVHNRLYYDMIANGLQSKALTSQTPSISSKPIADAEVIVSLTTHGRRIYDVYLAIESIMQGSIKPNRIVLWLSKDFQSIVLPQVLQNQQKRGLEIRYVDDIGPYTKSVPAFIAFPEANIITIDDDILYPFDTLEMLLSAHRQHPEMICANRVMDIQQDSHGNLTSLPTWKELTDKTRISRNNFFEGVGSVLYPANCFDRESLDSSLFLQMCPTTDDVWFNVQALRLNISIVSSNLHYLRFPLLINENVQDIALWQQNNNEEQPQNDLQLKAVLNYYHLSYGK